MSSLLVSNCFLLRKETKQEQVDLLTLVQTLLLELLAVMGFYMRPHNIFGTMNAFSKCEHTLVDVVLK